MHPHRDFEIISYVRRGAVTHEDSMGSSTAVGDVHVMSAGTGIVHPEQISGDEYLELFQIWVQPSHKVLTPR
jgi:redox-sensitive bicupin YhaK (pirin superfamily)